MDKQKKRIMWTILIVALIQMPGLALTPGINQIRTTQFSDYSLSLVQSALALSSLAQPIAAFCAAFLLNRKIVSKKAVIVFGLCLLGVNGLIANILNTEFWHLIVLSIILGVATGCFISNMFGLLFDYFEPSERQQIAGFQSAVINAGGITMGLMGGLLAKYMWYGGYLMLLIGFPVAILAIITIPKSKRDMPDNKNTGNDAAKESTRHEVTTQESAEFETAEYDVTTHETAGHDTTVETTGEIAEQASKPKLNPGIYYYCAIVFLFMMTYSVCGSNLSTHISGIGDSGLAGIAVAFQMGGGVVSGIFFGKLSEKAGDYALSLGFGTVFLGYMILSLFPMSIALTLIAVFLVGMSLSIMLPRCIYMVSTFENDPTRAATATALITIAAPSLGGFMSPIIITNLTTVLFGEETTSRYRFVAFVVSAFAIIIAMMTAMRSIREAERKIELENALEDTGDDDM